MPFLYPVLKTYGQGPFGTLTIGLSRGGSEGRFAPVKGDIAFLGEYQVSQTGIPLSETYILNVDIASFEGIRLSISCFFFYCPLNFNMPSSITEKVNLQRTLFFV